MMNCPLHDLYYFKNYLIDILELPYHKSTLLKEFKKIVKNRKFSSKIIDDKRFSGKKYFGKMIKTSFFIDYQAAMEGTCSLRCGFFLFSS